MIDGLKPYPAYKDSGVPWLGKVPEHWEVKPLKRWVRINASILPDTTPADSEFRYIDIGTVGTGFLIREPQQMQFGGAPSRARRILRRGDTIVSTVRTYLKAVYHVAGDTDALVCSTGFAVLTPRPGTQPRYVTYLAQSSSFADCISAESVGTAYPAIAESRLGSFNVPVPPLLEQPAIVRFLDYIDRRVRRCIRAKQKLNNLLEEYKQALIHQVVTGRIDIRTGQPYSAYKDSGVEWLGQVPAHWEVRRTKTLFQSRKQLNTDGSETNVLSLTLRGVVNNDPDNPEGLVPRDYKTYQIFERDDLVFKLIDLENVRTSRVGLVHERGIMSPAYVRLTLSGMGEVRFYYQQFYDLYQRSIYNQIGEGVRSTIGWSDLANLRILAPPLHEQTAIVEYLDAQTARIDAAMAATRRQIELLREYRTRLIADVVTGKVDVREVAARLSEEPAEEEAELEDTEETAEGEAADNEAAAETISEEEVEP